MSQIPVLISRIFSSGPKKLFQDIQIRGNTSRTLFTSIILSKKVSFRLSDIGEGIREVVVKDWFVDVGDKVSQFDNICEVQSDKASVTITSRYDGIITKRYYQIDDIALVGQPLVDLETYEKPNENGVTEEPVNESVLPRKTSELSSQNHVTVSSGRDASPSSSSDENTVICIPSVRRLADEHKINLSKIKGSGKQGRILKEDILNYMEKSQHLSTKESSEKPQASITFEQDDVKIVPIKGFTKAMFKTMTEALKIPHFVYSDEVKVTKLSKLRNELKSLPELDVKVTYLPFFIKAASNALRQYPIINSSIDETCENIIYHEHHNIGIAMATDQGLAVPVIKNVEKLTILEVSKELNRLVKSGKGGSFSPSDLSGATFSISNIGIVGGTYTKPVILPPQVAIFAIGAIQTLPRFDDAGNIIGEEILNISGSADHRVIDGVSMANFIKTIKKQIEYPNLLFLNL